MEPKYGQDIVYLETGRLPPRELHSADVHASGGDNDGDVAREGKRSGDLTDDSSSIHSSVRECSAKNGSVRDGSPRDGSPSDGSEGDGSVRDGSVRDGGARDGSVRDGSVRAGREAYGSVRDDGEGHGSMRDGSVGGGSVGDDSEGDGIGGDDSVGDDDGWPTVTLSNFPPLVDNAQAHASWHDSAQEPGHVQESDTSVHPHVPHPRARQSLDAVHVLRGSVGTNPFTTPIPIPLPLLRSGSHAEYQSEWREPGGAGGSPSGTDDEDPEGILEAALVDYLASQGPAVVDLQAGPLQTV